MTNLTFRPGDSVIVTHAPSNRIVLHRETCVTVGLLGTLVVPIDSGDGWIVSFYNFGYAALPNEWLARSTHKPPT